MKWYDCPTKVAILHGKLCDIKDVLFPPIDLSLLIKWVRGLINHEEHAFLFIFFSRSCMLSVNAICKIFGSQEPDQELRGPVLHSLYGEVTEDPWTLNTHDKF